MYGIRQITPPAFEPVSLALAKQHLIVASADTYDDNLISAYIQAARDYAERYTQSVLIEQTLQLTLDHFPWRTASNGTSHSFTPAYAELAPLYDTYAIRGMQINLPRSPLITVESITYLADDSVTVLTIPADQYIVDTSTAPGRIMPIPGAIWPYQLNYVPGSVQVTFTAGYSRSFTEALTVAENAAQLSLQSTSTPVVSYTTAGTALTLVMSSPAQGEYLYANGVITVNIADNGVSLTVTYRTPNVPLTIQQAMLLMIGSWYQTREGVSALNIKNVPLGVDALLSTNRNFIITLGN